ncbi:MULTISPECIES: DUF1638 domain-containing protein [unclassified Methanosarcina]|uniref:DUF1638 domain-containing protein n=1 Tax=unclassified Methanosarcina TaxID=2644672 RepID=UPI000615BA85|nr:MULTISPECIES: DUF1638 domain-containing protein [unclassified Methanosarcina]AKB17513.1 hypothetical protein MSWHS_0650 [Methanosarcina sp. WWM596]AKB20902.1 hypothetical protein MSWH1_0631 [Methanosarcina sp. WH1]
MKVMSIISCKIFEDEIVHLVEHDEEVDEVIVLKNGSSEDIVRKFGEIGCSCRELTLNNIEAQRFLKDVMRVDREGLMLVINILEVVGMGKKRTMLKTNLYDAILKMSLFSDKMLLFYGLCGNLLKDIEIDFKYLKCPLTLLRDPEGNIVDDCICAALGGKRAFVEKIKGFRGKRVFMLTSMWAANWEKMVVANGFARSLENLEESKLVFRAARYTQVAKINAGLNYQHNFESRVREFAAFYNFEITEIETDQAIFEMCYSELKHSLTAPVLM